MKKLFKPIEEESYYCPKCEEYKPFGFCLLHNKKLSDSKINKQIEKIFLKDNTEYKLESDKSILRLEIIKGKINIHFSYEVKGINPKEETEEEE